MATVSFASTIVPVDMTDPGWLAQHFPSDDPTIVTLTGTLIVSEDPITRATLTLEGTFNLTSEAALLASPVTAFVARGAGALPIVDIRGFSVPFGVLVNAPDALPQIFGGDDTIIAGHGGGIFTALGGGNDTIIGGPARDGILSDPGNNIFDGGAGFDTLSYANVPSAGGLTLNLTLAGPQDTGVAGTDTVRNIEHVEGTAQADAITGDGNDNIFTGLGGNDLLDGGAGFDTAVLAAARSAYHVVQEGAMSAVLPKSFASPAGADGIDTLLNIEQLMFTGITVPITADETINSLEYIASYTDLMGAFGANRAAGFDHYTHAGYYEGRTTTFNAYEYIASYGDLMGAFGANADAGASHYITAGRFEGRQATFSGLEYIASYGDLMNAFGSNIDAGASHYISAGRFEGRSVTFDGLEYIASYGDLINAFRANDDAGANHYIAAGRFEGRTVTFDGLEYVASYGDLINAFRALVLASPNHDIGTLHYLAAGRTEGRIENFDPVQYLANYADLQAAFGTNTESATIHYILTGYGEGRTDDLG